jgi:HlyD family secretion protein
MMRAVSLALALTLAAFPAAAQTLATAAEPAPPPEPGVQVPAITVTEVGRATLRDVVRVSGMIEPVERVFVQPQIEGLAIDAVQAEVGDRVEAGQVLAELSPAALELQQSQLAASRAAAEASIAQAEAALVEAKAARDEAVRVRDRSVALAGQGTVSQAAADQATASATSAEARVAVAEQVLEAARAQLAVVDAQIADVRLNLRRTHVAAPVAGVVSERAAQVGAIASAAAGPLFVIVRDGLLELDAEVPEADLLRLAPGQKATVSPVGVRDALSGHVRLVEPTIDPVTRLGRARISIDAAERVRSGLFAAAEILVAERETLALPVSAVSASNGGGYVLRVDEDGVVARVPVETGIRESGRVEILKGLEEGDRVVARAGAFVRPGDRINPVPLAATGN